MGIPRIPSVFPNPTIAATFCAHGVWMDNVPMHESAESGTGLPNRGLDPPVVGRAEDVAAIVDLLDRPEVGWVTIVGSGGVGKSTVATLVSDQFAYRGSTVAKHDLGDDATAEDARAGIERALESLPQGEPSLLTLNGVERHRNECALFAGAVRSRRPQAKVLATSRVATELSVDFQYALSALPWRSQVSEPPTGEIPAAQELFLHHAGRFSDPISPPDSRAVAAICQRVGGLPLALLAAANQLGGMNMSTLRVQVDKGVLPLLDGPSDLPLRQRSLIRVTEDSLNLLAEPNAQALRALAVFDGQIELSGAEAVLVGALGLADAQVLPTLGSLVRHSLLLVTSDPGTDVTMTYQVPPATRDALLITSDEQILRTAREAHAAHFLQRVANGHELSGPESGLWMRRVDLAIEDVRAALRFLIDIKDARAAQLATVLRNYWLRRGLLEEGLETVAEVVQAIGDSDSLQRVRLVETRAALTIAARSSAQAREDLQYCVDEWERLGDRRARARVLPDLALSVVESEGTTPAMPMFEEAISVLDDLEDRWWAARARSLMGATAAGSPELRDLARVTLDEAIEMFRGLGDLSYTNVPLQQLGRMLLEDGHDAQAATILTEGLRLARDVGDAWNASIFLNLLAEVELTRARPADAAARFTESLTLAVDIGARPRYIWCLEGLALAFMQLGEQPYACRLVGMASSVRASLGLRNWTEFPARPADLTEVQSGVSQEAYLSAWWLGAHMSVDDLLKELPGMLSEQPGASRARSSPNPDGLTNREFDVLRLIASGATSKSVAAELYISIETVGRHISNIYRKISATGRAEATAYAIRHGFV